MDNKVLLWMLLAFFLGCAVYLPIRQASFEMQDLNSKIDRILIFLDLDLNQADGVDGKE